MNHIVTKLIATTILGVASLSALAQTSTASEAARDAANMHAQDQYPIVSFKSTLTRADVKAELMAAQRAGTIANGDNYPILQQARSEKTHAQVREELLQAQRDGTITNGDDYPIIKQAPSRQTRADVKADLAAAQNNPAGNSLYQGH